MALGLMFVLIYPIRDVQITNLLPLFTNGVYPIFNGVFHTVFAFDDYIILLMIMGHIDFNKSTRKTLLLYLFSALSFVFNFYVIFVGSFGNTAVNQTLALNEVPLHNPYPATLGRLEWLTIIIWTSILLLESAILGKCACTCFDNIVKPSVRKYSNIVLVGIISIGTIFTYLQLYDVIKIVTSTPFAIILIIFHTILLLLLIISTIVTCKKRNKQGEAYEKIMEKVTS
jgi:hypothetical protein